MDIRALWHEIAFHPGKEIDDTLNAYVQAKNILVLNSNQLRHIVQVLEDPADPAQLRPLANRERLEAMFATVLQHFHNYLCSITTVIDQMRNIIGDLEGTTKGKSFVCEAHRKEYNAKVKVEFIDDPLAKFLKELRNYITHYEIPLASLTRHLGTEPEVAHLEVDLELMQRSGFKWKGTARKFMEMHSPKVRVLLLVDGYESKAESFHEYFVQAFYTHYENPLRELQSLRRQLNTALGWDGTAYR